VTGGLSQRIPCGRERFIRVEHNSLDPHSPPNSGHAAVTDLRDAGS